MLLDKDEAEKAIDNDLSTFSLTRPEKASLRRNSSLQNGVINFARHKKLLRLHSSCGWDLANPLWSNYKSQKGKFRSELRHHRKDLLNEFLDSLDESGSDQRKLFRDIRRYFGKSHTPTTSLVVNGIQKTFWRDGRHVHYTKLFSPSDDPSYNKTNLTYVKAAILINSLEHAPTPAWMSRRPSIRCH